MIYFNPLYEATSVKNMVAPDFYKIIVLWDEACQTDRAVFIEHALIVGNLFDISFDGFCSILFSEIDQDMRDPYEYSANEEADESVHIDEKIHVKVVHFKLFIDLIVFF